MISYPNSFSYSISYSIYKILQIRFRFRIPESFHIRFRIQNSVKGR